MIILVFSDAHGNDFYMKKVLESHVGRADYVFFLGDGLNTVMDFEDIYLGKYTFVSVSGNCDGFYCRPDKPPKTRMINIDGNKFMLTHGHEYFVKQGNSALIDSAVSNDADVVLYGHTHVPKNRYLPEEDTGTKPLYVFNPGSISVPHHGLPTFGLIETTPKGIVLNITEVSK